MTALKLFEISAQLQQLEMLTDSDDLPAEVAERIQKRADSIRAYLLFHMQAITQKRIETPEVVIRRQNNPAAVVVTDEHAIPAQFWVQPEPPPLRIDKKAIKAAIDAGARVEGAYVEAGEHLRIEI